MEIMQAYQTKNPSYTRNRAITPVGIFVHSTGANNRNLKRYVDAPDRLGKNEYNNHWNKADATKSVHAFIGYDKNKKVIVTQTLPYDRACWGAGGGSKGSYNYDPQAHIQFEICQGSNTDVEYYNAAIACAEEYCAYLCRMYGWSADKITSHKEAAAAGYASNHDDPQRWMRHFCDNMDKFRARVQMRINGVNLPVDAPEETHKEISKQSEKTPINENTEVQTVNITLDVLRIGSKSNQVRTAQRLLSAFGYNCGNVDGIFGERTEAATKIFQTDNGLTVDGIIGKSTWTKLLK